MKKCGVRCADVLQGQCTKWKCFVIIQQHIHMNYGNGFLIQQNGWPTCFTWMKFYRHIVLVIFFSNTAKQYEFVLCNIESDSEKTDFRYYDTRFLPFHVVGCRLFILNNVYGSFRAGISFLDSNRYMPGKGRYVMFHIVPTIDD